MKVKSGVNRSIVDDLHFSVIQPRKMDCESGVTRSIIDQLHCADMVKWKAKVVLLEVSLMNLILGISKET